MKKYEGITYFKIFDNSIARKIFRRFFCKRGVHLFDEVVNDKEQYLHCDACELIVYVEKIDKTYQKKKNNDT